MDIDIEEQKIVTETVLNYRDFLLASWFYWKEANERTDWHENPYFLQDWMQVTWEMLVERPLLNFYSGERMLPFSNGEAMIFDYKQLKPTHGIFVRKKRGRALFEDGRGGQIPEDKFFVPSYFGSILKDHGGPENGPIYGYGPPFDFLMINELGTKNFYDVRVEEVEFFFSFLIGVMC